MCPQTFKVGPEKKVFNCQTGSDVLVPVLNLSVDRGRRAVRCTFLLDTGAQFSIINKQLVDNKVGKCLSPPVARMVSSFGLPSSKSKGFNYPAQLTLPCGLKTNCVFFAMDDFKLSLQIPMLTSVVRNLELAGNCVSPDYPGRKRDEIEVVGNLGNDIPQYFSELDLGVVNLFAMSVKVLRFANRCIPFGSVAPFIQPDKRCEIPG